MKLQDIKIYKITDPDGYDYAHSLEAEPGSGDEGCIHTEVDPENPEADLLLVGFRTAAEAEAFIAGSRVLDYDSVGTVGKMISDDLSIVLVEYFDSTNEQILYDDHRL